MRITDAMTLRDGGTTCVTVEDEGKLVHVTADHRRARLPWLPRPRFVFISSARFGRNRRLLPGGSEERRYISAIARQAIDHLGYDQVRELLSGNGSIATQDLWSHVLNFLWIMQRSRIRDVLGRRS